MVLMAGMPLARANSTYFMLSLKIEIMLLARFSLRMREIGGIISVVQLPQILCAIQARAHGHSSTRGRRSAVTYGI